jgi:hypothetical protein
VKDKVQSPYVGVRAAQPLGVIGGHVPRSRIVATLAIALLAATCASVSDAKSPALRPPSRDAVHRAIVLPARVPCDQHRGFEMPFGKAANAAGATILKANVAWSEKSTVTVYQPSHKHAPFATYLFMETDKTHVVAWSMGVAYFSTGDLATEAAEQLLDWYEDQTGVEANSSLGYIHNLRLGQVTLSVMAVEKTVRVTCEHNPTVQLMI